MNAQDSEFEISLVRDDLLFRLQRRFGLIPDHGLGLIRRAIFFSLVAWLPIMAWAVFNGRALPGTVSEPLLQHFGIHVRFLLALPLLIVGEGSVHGMTTLLIPYFHTSGLIPKEQREAFREVLRGIFQLRNSSFPWIVIAALIVAWIGFQPPSQDKHELVWANIGEPTRFNLGFGGWWLDHVAQPIFFALLCAWLWRLILLFLLLKRIAALDLQIVPTHSDRAGGLGFLERLTKAFSLFAFALSAVLASRLAHDVMYHGVHVMSLKGGSCGFPDPVGHVVPDAIDGIHPQTCCDQKASAVGLWCPGRRTRPSSSPPLDFKAVTGRLVPAGGSGNWPRSRYRRSLRDSGEYASGPHRQVSDSCRGITRLNSNAGVICHRDSNQRDVVEDIRILGIDVPF